MVMPKDEIQSEMNKAWRTYMEALEKSLDTLEQDIAVATARICERQ